MTNNDIRRVRALLRDSEEAGDDYTAALCDLALGVRMDRLSCDQYAALGGLRARRARLYPSDAFRRLAGKLAAL